jgi:hypothetical protein
MKPVWEPKCDRAVPRAVLNALEERYSDALLGQAVKALRWDGLNGCWCLAHLNMYIGIEESDGYMHT